MRRSLEHRGKDLGYWADSKSFAALLDITGWDQQLHTQLLDTDELSIISVKDLKNYLYEEMNTYYNDMKKPC